MKKSSRNFVEKKKKKEKIIGPGSNEIRGVYFDTTINPVSDYINEKVGRQTRPYNAARHGFKIQYYRPVFQSGRNHKFFTSFRRNPVHLNISNRKPIYSIRVPEITFARCQFALGLTWRMAPRARSKNKCSPTVSSRKKSRTNAFHFAYLTRYRINRLSTGGGEKNSSTYIIYICNINNTFGSCSSTYLRIFPSKYNEERNALFETRERILLSVTQFSFALSATQTEERIFQTRILVNVRLVYNERTILDFSHQSSNHCELVIASGIYILLARVSLSVFLRRKKKKEKSYNNVVLLEKGTGEINRSRI